MREYVILGCVAGAVACGGGRAAIQDSLRGDTTAVPGRPAIPVAPLPTESIASHPRAIPRSGSAGASRLYAHVIAACGRRATDSNTKSGGQVSRAG